MSSLRYLDHQQITKSLEYRSERNKNWAGSWRYASALPVTDRVKNNCHSFADWLLAKTNPYKFVVYDTHIGHFYTDLDNEVKSITDIKYLKIIQVKQANLDVPKDCIYRKNSEYENRMYLANQKLDMETRANLKQFLLSRSDIRISPLFKEWIEYNNMLNLFNGLFIDYNDQGFPLILQLVAPVKIKKSFTIINDKY